MNITKSKSCCRKIELRNTNCIIDTHYTKGRYLKGVGHSQAKIQHVFALFHKCQHLKQNKTKTKQKQKQKQKHKTKQNKIKQKQKAKTETKTKQNKNAKMTLKFW